MSAVLGEAGAEQDVTLLELDSQAERSVSILRLVAATLVGSSSIVILIFASPSAFGAVIALLGLGASIGWVFAFRHSKKRVGQRERYYLRLDAEGLTLAQGGEPRTLLWSAVRDANVSEERLVLELNLRDGSKLDIPPIFRGVGIYDVEEMVNEHLGAAPAPSHG